MMTTPEARELIRAWLESGEFGGRLPEVAALKGVRQPRKFHREGDAFTHTLLALDAVPDEADVRVFWAVLLHDIGKAGTTELHRGRWRSPGHAPKGAKQVPEIMARLGFPELGEDVAWLVKHHDVVLSWHVHVGDRLTRRQERFMRHPLFLLLVEVLIADAAGSFGGSDKGETAAWLGEIAEAMRE